MDMLDIQTNTCSNMFQSTTIIFTQKNIQELRALIASSAVTILDLGIPTRDVSNCLAYQMVQ